MMRLSHTIDFDLRPWIRHAALTRAFWASMLLLHLVVLAGSVQQLCAISTPTAWPNAISRVGGLALAIGFFVLKFIDVRWLRIRSGWRPAVASVVVVALLHGSAVSRQFDETTEFPAAPLGTVFFAGILLEGESARRSLCQFTHRLVGTLTGNVPLLPFLLVGRADMCSFRILHSDIRTVRSSRAPPF